MQLKLLIMYIYSISYNHNYIAQFYLSISKTSIDNMLHYILAHFSAPSTITLSELARTYTHALQGKR